MMPPYENNLRIGIYAGEGASHSWLWFVDLLEKYDFHRLSFLDENDFHRRVDAQDVLLVSGGDTFAVANALQEDGPAALRAFLERGGLYIGSCAGAYLPLHSSQEPLAAFNFVKCKINNLARDLPPAHRLPTKFFSAYGCSYVVHPVREEVRVRMAEDSQVWGGREILVPLYGGPPMQPSDDIVPLAFYSGFTEKTLFLTEPAMAESVYIGKVAACEKRIGEGRMVLLGPHFEHPWFPDGNEIVHHWIREYGRAAGRGELENSVNGGEPATGAPEGCWKELRIEISNMRIRAAAMARQDVHWQIGAKFYEPEKIAYFLDAIWKRMGGRGGLSRDAETSHALGEAIVERAKACHHLLRRLADGMRDGEDTTPLAESLFPALKALVVEFLEMYFLVKRGGRVAG